MSSGYVILSAFSMFTNLRNLSRHLFRLTNASPERKASRQLLSAAKKGNSEQYLALASHYIALVQAYFGNCIHEDYNVRMERTGQIFASLWEQIQYAEQLSDFEYMLACTLIHSTPKGPTESDEILVTRIRKLSPELRFAFLAMELDQWPARWVALVLRMNTRKLHQLLTEARCELCGIRWVHFLTKNVTALKQLARG